MRTCFLRAFSKGRDPEGIKKLSELLKPGPIQCTPGHALVVMHRQDRISIPFYFNIITITFILNSLVYWLVYAVSCFPSVIFGTAFRRLEGGAILREADGKKLRKIGLSVGEAANPLISAAGYKMSPTPVYI